MSKWCEIEEISISDDKEDVWVLIDKTYEEGNVYVEIPIKTLIRLLKEEGYSMFLTSN